MCRRASHTSLIVISAYGHGFMRVATHVVVVHLGANTPDIAALITIRSKLRQAVFVRAWFVPNSELNKTFSC
jgi:hypothetical protein